MQALYHLQGSKCAGCAEVVGVVRTVFQQQYYCGAEVVDVGELERRHGSGKKDQPAGQVLVEWVVVVAADDEGRAEDGDRGNGAERASVVYQAVGLGFVFGVGKAEMRVERIRLSEQRRLLRDKAVDRSRAKVQQMADAAGSAGAKEIARALYIRTSHTAQIVGGAKDEGRVDDGVDAVFAEKVVERIGDVADGEE